MLHPTGIKIEISEDGMLAEMDFSEVLHMEHITRDLIIQTFKAAGIKFGIDTKLIEQINKEPTLYQKQKVKIAVGTESVPYIPARVEYAFKHPAMEEKPLERDDGSVDFKEFRRLNNVKMGQYLASFTAAVQGSPGIKVTGEKIPIEKMIDDKLINGQNTVWNIEHNKLYATGDGLATWTEDGKVHVFPSYDIQGDVCYATGHVDFVGTVNVNGNIMPGFRVHAAGDVFINGNCDGGQIIAGGSVFINGGIIGSSSASVKAGVDVHALYIQDTNVIAGRNIVVKQSIMRSVVDAGSVLRCDSARSLVVGGELHAGESAFFKTVGNVNESTTLIFVGLYQKLREESDEIKELMHPLRLKIEQTMNAISLLDRVSSVQRLNKTQIEMLDQLQKKRMEAQNEMKQMSERWSELQLIFDKADEGQVTVNKTIYAGAIVQIGKQAATVKDSLQSVVYRLVADKVREIPLFPDTKKKKESK